LLGKLQRHRTNHEREHGVGVSFDGWNKRPKILRTERRPNLLHDFSTAIFESFLETAN